jgi:hypothetical protein
MRRGIMVVGENAASVADDLRALPRVIAGFVAAAPVWAWRQSGENASPDQCLARDVGRSRNLL